MRRLIPLVLLAVALSTPAATAQTFTSQINFVQQLPTSSPTARREHAMVFDAARSRTVLFGGWGPTGRLGDTWTWDGTTWQPRFVAAPPARHQHAMAYDPNRHVVVLFGGNSASGNMNDTWEWNGTTWAQVASSGPSVRYGHAMAFDGNLGAVLLHGGDSGPSETWAWDGTTWTQVATGPSLTEPAMAFDELHQLVVMVQGSDLYTWDGSTWTQRPPLGFVPTLAGSGLVYHGRRERIVATGVTQPSYVAQRTYELDASTGYWSQLSEAGASMPARDYSTLVYDQSSDQLVFFGGFRSPSTYFNDTWSTVPLPAGSLTFGVGCGQSPLDLQPVAPPIVGQFATAELTNAPTSIAVASVGFSDTSFSGFPLPVPLDSYGLAGCDLLISPDIFGYVLGTAGSGNPEFAFPVPNVARLVGLYVYAQVVCVAPGENTANLIVSNGVRWTIGDS